MICHFILDSWTVFRQWFKLIVVNTRKYFLTKIAYNFLNVKILKYRNFSLLTSECFLYIDLSKWTNIMSCFDFSEMIVFYIFRVLRAELHFFLQPLNPIPINRNKWRELKVSTLSYKPYIMNGTLIITNYLITIISKILNCFFKFKSREKL